MKKLSILAALALVTTVGGVYATWNYVGSDPSSPASTTKTLTITQGIVSGSTGKLEVTTPSTLIIDDSGNYVPGWGSQCEGDLTITFTPGKGAPDATFKYTINILGNSYADPETGAQKIIDITDQDPEAEGDQIIDTFEYKASNPASAILSWNIGEVKDLLPLNPNYTVSTYEEYKAYEKVVTGVTITIDVVQVI